MACSGLLLAYRGLWLRRLLLSRSELLIVDGRLLKLVINRMVC